MDMEKKHGLMVHVMKETIKMERKTEKESSNGQMDQLMKDSL
jgi:hypothetical protein